MNVELINDCDKDVDNLKKKNFTKYENVCRMFEGGSESGDVQVSVYVSKCITNIVLRSSPTARTESGSRERCLPSSPTPGRRPGLIGGSRRTTSPWRGVGTGSRAFKIGNLGHH